MAEAFGLGCARVIWTEEHGDLAYVPLWDDPALADRNARFITDACNMHAALVRLVRDGQRFAPAALRRQIEQWARRVGRL